MNRNLKPSLERIFGHEGGLSLDRADRGNWTSGVVGKGELKGTKYGVSAMSYPREDIRSLTLAHATQIYRRDFAARIGFDDLPGGVDYAMLDFAINSGPSCALKFAQRIVGVEDDGVFGPATRRAVRAFEPDVLINMLWGARLAFLRSLSTWSRYGKGWERRVDDVRAHALAMATGEPHRPIEGGGVVAPAPAAEPGGVDAGIGAAGGAVAVTAAYVQWGALGIFIVAALAALAFIAWRKRDWIRARLLRKGRADG